MEQTTRSLPPSELAWLVKSLGIHQVEIAIATGITQSHVSRILSGAISTRAKAYQRVTSYVSGKSKSTPSRRVALNSEITDAVASIWDGSDKQAKILAAVIRSLGPLTKGSSSGT